MPRKSRIDAPRGLQHVIARGINRQRIFLDDADKNSFLDRLSGLLKDYGIKCYAWAAIPHNHLARHTARLPAAEAPERRGAGGGGLSMFHFGNNWRIPQKAAWACVTNLCPDPISSSIEHGIRQVAR
jgi:hypothetical protein